MALNDGRVVTNFIAQALQNKPLSIFGDGSQTRSFCYVTDLIEGLSSLFFTDAVYQPINLGNPMPITILELASEIIKLAGSKSEIVFHPLPSDDPRDREPNITKAKKLLDWEPKVFREVGLKLTIENVRLQLANSFKK